jgi:PAS domain S-box-containing protein
LIDRLTEGLDMNQIGTWDWDICAGRVVWSNKTYEIMGLASADTTPSYETARRLAHTEDLEDFEQAFRQCKEVTGAYDLRSRIIRADGAIRHVVARGRLERGPDSEPLRMFGTLQDVTEEHEERAQARNHEASSRASHRRLEQQLPLTLEASPIAMLMVDPERGITNFNTRSEELFGYSRSEILGRRVEQLVPEILRSEHERLGAAYTKQPARRSMGRGRQLHCRHKNGTLIPVKIALSPVETPDGRRVIAAVVDLSDHKRLEEQVRQAQKLEAIGTLASGVAHDFNNLLMGVSGCANIAISTLEPERPEHLYLNEIMKAAERGTAIAHQLLTFSRKRKAQVEVFDFNPMVTEMQELFRRLLGEDIGISVQIGAGDGHVLADRGLMQQVLMNLVVNARHAMATGGKLSIETHNEEVAEPNPHSLRAGEYVVLTVTDNGVGMTEEVRLRAFEPFFTTRENEQGTGLGLSIVYGITKEAGGHIGVQSRVNEGTTFKVMLPTTQALPATGPEEEASDGREQVLGTILVVEDSLEVLMVIRFYLEEAGHKVLGAASGEEAVEHCERHQEKIDLVLIDVVLPGMSGAETFRKIRELRPELEDVVFMSAHESELLTKRGQLEPGIQTLQKPFGSDALLLCVRESLEKHKPGPG